MNDQINWGLMTAAGKIEHAGEILGNPMRIVREARLSALHN